MSALIAASLCKRAAGGLIERGIEAPPPLPADLELVIAACWYLNGRPDADAAHRRLRGAVEAVQIAEIDAGAPSLLQLRIAAEMALRSRSAGARKVAGEILDRQLKQHCAELRDRADARPEAYAGALAEVLELMIARVQP